MTEPAMMEMRELSDVDKLKEQKITELSKALKVIGHPLRLKILVAIYTKKCKVGGLVECLNEPQPIVSQQIAILRKGKLIEGHKNKNTVVYKICDDFTLKIVKQVVKSFGIES